MEKDFKRQEDLLKEIEELEWNCKAGECVEKCQYYISEFPNCKKVIPSYSHMYRYINYVKATDIAKKLFDEDIFFFKNTYIYALQLFEFDKRGKDDIQQIYNTFKEYNGEKDIYYYMALSLSAKQLQKYDENVKYLLEAVKIFGKDRIIARAYHHLTATTRLYKFLEKSINIQPNFDYNYIHLGSFYEDQEDFEDAEHSYNQILRINPQNSLGYYYLAKLYSSKHKYIEALIYYDLYLKQGQYISSHVASCIKWRIKNKNVLKSLSTQKLSTKIIKGSFIFEIKNDNNLTILEQYCQNLDLFAQPCDQISQMRELLLYFIQQSIYGYLFITSKEPLHENKISSYLIKEANLNLQSIFLILTYQYHVKTEISYQPEYLLWDLYFD